MQGKPISAKQLTTMSVLGVLTLGSGFSAREAAKMAGTAGWLLPILTGLIMTLVLLMIGNLYRRHPGQPLDKIILTVFGGVFGRIFLGLHLVWVILEMGIVARSHVERLVTTGFSQMHYEIFLAVLLIASLVVCRKRLDVLARAASVYLVAILVVGLVMVIRLVTKAPVQQLSNLLPYGPIDGERVLSGLPVLLGIMGFFVSFQFLGHNVFDLEQLSKANHRALRWFILLKVGFLALLWWIFSATMVPILQTITMISALNTPNGSTLEHVEPFVLGIWTMVDFIMLAMLGFLAIHLLGTILKTDQKHRLSTPIHVLAFVLALGVNTEYGLFQQISLWLFRTVGFGVTIGGTTLVWLVERATTRWWRPREERNILKEKARAEAQTLPQPDNPSGAEPNAS